MSLTTDHGDDGRLAAFTSPLGPGAAIEDSSLTKASPHGREIGNQDAPAPERKRTRDCPYRSRSRKIDREAMPWQANRRRSRSVPPASKGTKSPGGDRHDRDIDDNLDENDDGSVVSSLSRRIQRSLRGAGRALLCTVGSAKGNDFVNSEGDGGSGSTAGGLGRGREPSKPNPAVRRSSSSQNNTASLSHNDSTDSRNSSSHSGGEGQDEEAMLQGSLDSLGGLDGGGFVLTVLRRVDGREGDSVSNQFDGFRAEEEDQEDDPRMKMMDLQLELRNVEQQLLFECTPHGMLDDNEERNRWLESLPEGESLDDGMSTSTISTAGCRSFRSTSGYNNGYSLSFKGGYRGELGYLSGGKRNECGVCAEPLLSNRFIGACLPCGHCVHEDCFYGSWASTLLQNDAESSGDDNDTDGGYRGAAARTSLAPCAQCGSVVNNFGRLSINVDDAMGPSEDLGTSDYAFKKLLSRSKMVTMVRRCLSVPSSPKLVCEVLRLTMDRIRRVTDIDTGEVGRPIKAEFLAVGGHVSMMHSVTRYRNSPDVCGWANALLAELSVTHADVLYLTTPDLACFVAASMLRHPLHVALQSNGCCTLTELLKSSYGVVAMDEIDRANGFTAVREALVRSGQLGHVICQNAVSFLTLAAELNPILACQHVCSDRPVLRTLVGILEEAASAAHDKGGDGDNNCSSQPRASGNNVLVRLVSRLVFLACGRPEFRAVLVSAGVDRALYGIYLLGRSPDEYSYGLSKAVLRRLGRPLSVRRTTESSLADI